MCHEADKVRWRPLPDYTIPCMQHCTIFWEMTTKNWHGPISLTITPKGRGGSRLWKKGSQSRYRVRSVCATFLDHTHRRWSRWMFWPSWTGLLAFLPLYILWVKGGVSCPPRPPPPRSASERGSYLYKCALACAPTLHVLVTPCSLCLKISLPMEPNNAQSTSSKSS